MIFSLPIRMKFTHASFVSTVWLLAILYWTYSHRVYSHNSLEWHRQSCLISIVSHNQVTSKLLEWYYANTPNDIINSWECHAQCCLFRKNSHKQLISKHLDWYFANTHNTCNNSWIWHEHCCLLSINAHNLVITRQQKGYYVNTLNAFEKHNSWKWDVDCCLISINSCKPVISNQLEWYYACELDVCLKINLFLIVPSPQTPFIHKWKGEWSRNKRKKPKLYNENTSYFCRMAYARSLEKSLDGAKDMELTQSKKRTSSIASLLVVEKAKNKSNPQSKNFPLWLGFKAMNNLNESQGLPKESHKSVSELIKIGMYESEALECQDCIPSYPYIAQELWPSKNNLGVQNYHYTQIPSEVEVN